MCSEHGLHTDDIAPFQIIDERLELFNRHRALLEICVVANDLQLDIVLAYIHESELGARRAERPYPSYAV